MKRNLLHIFWLIFALSLSLPLFARHDRKRKSKPCQSVAMQPDHFSLKAKVNTFSYATPVDVTSITLSNGYICKRSTEGIDVSHYQGNIDWEKVGREANISYAYIKATEGESLKDDCYRRNLIGARRAGISVGSYHFYRPNVPPEVQLRNMIETVKLSEQDLVPIVDVEVASRNHSKFVRDLEHFVRLVERHYGKRPLLYTYQKFYNKHFKGRFKHHHWMIARYSTDQPWLEDGKNFIMWQYTQRGVLPGIEGYVDRSLVMKGFQLEALQL